MKLEQIAVLFRQLLLTRLRITKAWVLRSSPYIFRKKILNSTIVTNSSAGYLQCQAC